MISTASLVVIDPDTLAMSCVLGLLVGTMMRTVRSKLPMFVMMATAGSSFLGAMATINIVEGSPVWTVWAGGIILWVLFSASTFTARRIRWRKRKE